MTGAALAEPAESPAPLAAARSGPIVQAPPPFTDDDLLLFAASADGMELADSFEAYSSRAGVFLPLGALARLLDLDVSVDPLRRRAEGTVGTPARSLRLDADSRRLVVDGVATALSETDLAFRDDELWVRAEVLEKILPLKITADIPGLNLQFAPTQPLPFQERLQRELRSRQFAGARAAAQPEPLAVATPYRLFTPPTVDLNLSASLGNRAPRRTGGFDVRAAGDLAGAGAQLFVGSDADFRLDSVRLLFSRKDPAGRIAGPFGATRSSLGDTFTPALALGARSVAGRGFTITSEPLERASVFEHADLRGELPLGFQVELYVNEVLRGSQGEPVEGRYEFLDVPLVYGLNVVRLVFYGPRGERREEVRRINMGGGQLARGQTTFSFGAVQEGRNLIDVGRGDRVTSGEPGAGRWRIVGGVAHGLAEATTLTASFAQYTPRPDDTRTLGALGLISAFGAAAVQLDAAVDGQGGGALAAGLATRAGSASIVVRHSEYAGGFIDETQASGDGVIPLRRHTDVAVDTVLMLLRNEVPTSFHLDWNGLQDGGQEVQAAARFSKAVGRRLVSTGFIYAHRHGGASPGMDRLDGLLDASGPLGDGWQVRAGALYSVAPTLKLRSAGFSADRNLGERSALHLGAAHAFASGETTFEAGQTWRLQPADISLVASYATRARDFRIGVQLSVGFGYDPARSRYVALGANAAAGGAMAVDAFLDANGDGVRNPGEKPLPGVVLQGGRRAETTNVDGRALITGLGDAASAEAELDMSSLDDPYLLPAAPAVRITPRPGRIADVPIPVTISGEVELHAEFVRPGEAPRAISALHVELVDPAGQVVAGGSSEFDGVLVLESLRPGAYTLRLEPAQATRLKLVLTAPATVKIPPSGGFAGRVRVQVTTQAGADAARANP